MRKVKDRERGRGGGRKELQTNYSFQRGEDTNTTSRGQYKYTSKCSTSDFIVQDNNQ